MTFIAQVVRSEFLGSSLLTSIPIVPFLQTSHVISLSNSQELTSVNYHGWLANNNNVRSLSIIVVLTANGQIPLHKTGAR